MALNSDLRPLTMSRRLTYSLSALFLLVTIVGVLAAIVSSRAGAAELFSLRDTRGESHYGPAIIALAVSGLFGAILMAYNSLDWEMIAIGYGIGVGVGMVALRLLLWPNDYRLVLGGAAAILVYAIAIRATAQ